MLDDIIDKIERGEAKQAVVTIPLNTEQSSYETPMDQPTVAENKSNSRRNLNDSMYQEALLSQRNNQTFFNTMERIENAEGLEEDEIKVSFKPQDMPSLNDRLRAAAEKKTQAQERLQALDKNQRKQYEEREERKRTAKEKERGERERERKARAERDRELEEGSREERRRQLASFSTDVFTPQSTDSVPIVNLRNKLKAIHEKQGDEYALSPSEWEFFQGGLDRLRAEQERVGKERESDMGVLDEMADMIARVPGLEPGEIPSVKEIMAYDPKLDANVWDDEIIQPVPMNSELRDAMHEIAYMPLSNLNPTNLNRISDVLDVESYQQAMDNGYCKRNYQTPDRENLLYKAFVFEAFAKDPKVREAAHRIMTGLLGVAERTDSYLERMQKIHGYPRPRREAPIRTKFIRQYAAYWSSYFAGRKSSTTGFNGVFNTTDDLSTSQIRLITKGLDSMGTQNNTPYDMNVSELRPSKQDAEELKRNRRFDERRKKT